MGDVESTAGPVGRPRVLRWALLLAVLLVVLGVGVEVGRVQAPVPAGPVDPVIVVEWEARDGDRSERISV